MAEGEGWLDAIVAAAEEGPVQIIARTSATTRAVYRRFAHEGTLGRRRGWAGVEVTTLGGLLVSLKPKRLRPVCSPGEAQELPRGHPWKPLLDDRPGLRRLLRRHAGRLHEARLAGIPLHTLREELHLLLEASWGVPDHLETASRLLAHPPPAQRRFAVGFAPAPFSFLGGVGPLELSLLSALGPVHVAAGDPRAARPGPLRALRLPDAAAEARAVAREAHLHDRTLVLVADGPSEERIQAALLRNGIPVADDAASPLTRHALASVIAPLLPLFASKGSAPLEARHLLRLLTDPVLARTPPAGHDVAAPAVDKPRAALRHVRDLVLACRRIRAPLAEWLELFARFEAEATERFARSEPDEQPGFARHLASCRIVLAQTRALAARSRETGTLRDVGALLSDLGLASPDDRVGRAIVRALAEEGHRPADPEEFAEALAGSVGSGRVGDGVQVLLYSAYDGRPCERLVLTGVHDKGLGRLPPDDPLVTHEESTLLGLPTPRVAVAERLALARWAATRAGETVALVCETDSAGRRVSPPPDLELSFDDSAREAAYGLTFDLPELRDLRAFAPGSGEVSPLAMQIDAEWARTGVAFEGGRSPLVPKGPTLADHLEASRGAVPEDLQGWLGRSGPHPESSSGLPPRFALSATRLTAFTQCLYRAWCESVLRLKPVEELEEDLDASEVGTAVHGALQDGLQGQRLLVPRAELERARENALKRLAAATPGHIEKQAEATGRLDTEPLALARQGLTRRWLAHWELYLEKRVRALEEASAELASRALDALETTPLFAEVLDAVGGPGLKKAPKEELRKSLRRALARRGGRLEGVLEEADEIVSRLAACHRPRVRAAMLGPARAALATLCAEIRARIDGLEFDPAGDLEVAASELGFGHAPPLELRLGEDAVPVRGNIDAVLHRRGEQTGRANYRIVDFKTGSVAATEEQLTESFTQPQLAFYGLALGAVGPLAEAHRGPVRVEGVELDYVRSRKVVGATLASGTLDRARSLFGALLDEARKGSFPLAPHPRGCPLLGARARCDFEELCRLRPGARPEEEGPAEGEGGSDA